MIFAFVVRHLRWLGRVPGAPQLLDAFLLTGTLLLHPRRHAAMEQLQETVAAWTGVTLHVHRFGGTGFRLGRRELGHVHGNGLLDVFVGRETQRQLVSAGRALPHHVFPDSAWVSFWIKDERNLTEAEALLGLALKRIYSANFGNERGNFTPATFK